MAQVSSRIPYVDLARQWEEERDLLLPVIDKALSSGQWVLGPDVENLEAKLADYCGVAHVVTLNSGTDALVCGLHAMGVGKGHEVITPANSFIASTAAILHVGAAPVFVDVGPDQNLDVALLDQLVSDRTRAVMPVHLTGRMADMNAVHKFADRHGVMIIEDAAQAIGAERDGRRSGATGVTGCFSTHPLKNLNAVGDGGFLATNDEVIAENVRLMRSHGLVDRQTAVSFGFVSRMDTVQAAILSFRLDRLDSLIFRRREIAHYYEEALLSSDVFYVAERPGEFNTYHTFVVQVDDRDGVRRRMLAAGVETSVHYPKPIHLQPAAQARGLTAECPVVESQSKRILSLPVNQFLTDNDAQRVVATLLDAVGGSQ